MSNSGFLFTDAGLAQASLASPTGPKIVIQSFRVGGGYGYNPSRSQTSLQGSVLYTGVPSTYTIVDNDTIDVVLPIDINIGDFMFGEIGLYDPSNVLLAVCVFSNLQEKIRAVGTQSGNRYRIHARLKLAQAPAICVVQVSDPMTLLEVPGWTSLFPPVDQLDDANAAIVHESNYSGDSILVIRDSDTEWAVVGYRKLFSANTTDGGCVMTTSGFTHPSLDATKYNLPESTSRYIIKFSTGDIRRISSSSGANELTWTGTLGYTPSGAFSVWEDEGACCEIPLATMRDYNKLAADFNRFWSVPSGTYSATNAGINQVAIPTLTSRPMLSDWTLLSSSLRKLMTLQNYSTTQINQILDDSWIVDPSNQNGIGMYLSMQNFGYIVNAIESNLDGSRNNVNLSYLETATVAALNRSRTLPFSTTVYYDFTASEPDENTRLGLANGGGALTITGTSNNASSFFTGWQTLFTNVGSIVVDRGTTYASNTGVGAGSSYGVANMDSTLRQLYTYSYTIAALSSTATWKLEGKTIGGGAYQFRLTFAMTGSPYSVATPGSMSIAVTARRPVTTLINNPAFAYYSGVQLGTSTF
jgi:hypothetical protein